MKKKAILLELVELYRHRVSALEGKIRDMSRMQGEERDRMRDTIARYNIAKDAQTKEKYGIESVYSDADGNVSSD